MLQIIHVNTCIYLPSMARQPNGTWWHGCAAADVAIKSTTALTPRGGLVLFSKKNKLMLLNELESQGSDQIVEVGGVVVVMQINHNPTH